ncbi:MAG: molybdopterin-binding protein [Deltaproteobacteria bacterium]|nr:molybdopterin-binding protein [Deltaproteobacteria bacterium]
MLKTVKVEEAVGMPLAHDITEIRPNEFKGASFHKGHVVKMEDVQHLKRLGKHRLYILDLPKHQVHEDQAALELAQALAGPGVTYTPQPREGKIQFEAAHDGLFKVNAEPLIHFNMMPEVMCAAIHNNTPVKRGKALAGTRAIPLVIERKNLNSALQIARNNFPVFAVKPFRKLRAKLIITGNEVYSGLIEDKFAPIVTEKIRSFGASLLDTVFLPDDATLIAEKIRRFAVENIDLIITTGGMSVDPDDVTRLGVRMAGMDHIYYGAAVLPGTMFQLAYKENLAVVSIPAGALYHPVTTFDLILPRLLAGEKPNNEDLARFAVGGFCHNCSDCNFPACSFGKSVCF